MLPLGENLAGVNVNVVAPLGREAAGKSNEPESPKNMFLNKDGRGEADENSSLTAHTVHALQQYTTQDASPDTIRQSHAADMPNMFRRVEHCVGASPPASKNLHRSVCDADAVGSRLPSSLEFFLPTVPPVVQW